MTALLIAFLLTQAGIQAPAPKGFATGIVRSANGSPASGVRVYAVPAGDPNAVSTGATVFESLAQTDATGRYRLEVPAGRYYIAVGSVTSPTYYPDTASIASAKAISIVANSTVESVDFSRYTAAAPTAPGLTGIVVPALPPGSTGVLSGVVRDANGSVLAGITVMALPVSMLANTATPNSYGYMVSTNGGVQTVTRYATSPGVQSTQFIRAGRTTTDNQGRYRMDSISPDSYKIVAGFLDSPIFYPGESDIQKAPVVTTTPTTLLTTLDITFPASQRRFSVRGRVSANNGQPVGGATLNLQRINSGAAPAIVPYLPARSYMPAIAGGDGTFEITDVVPGEHSLQARIGNSTTLTKTINVADDSVRVDFDFSINVLSGRVVMEDGSPVPDTSIGPIAISTTSNPNFVATNLLPLSNDGAFSSVIEAGDYRFYIQSLPSDYVVRKIAFGSVDLASNLLHVTSDVPSAVDIRVAKGMNPGVRVRGKVLDAVTGAPALADRIELCCFASGPFERLSAAVLPDGSFDFASVPPGRYGVDLRRKTGQSAQGIANRTIEVGNQELSGIVFASAGQVASVTATVTLEGGASLPAGAAVEVALTLRPGSTVTVNTPISIPSADSVSIPMGRLSDGTYWTPFPVGVQYKVSIANLPEGYVLKSISGPGSTAAASVVTVDGETRYSGVAPGVLSIVLQPAPAR